MDQLTETTDIFSTEDYLVHAATGKRFLNYVIDVILFYVLFIGAGIIFLIASPESINDIDDSPGFNIMDRLISLVAYAIYMGFVEALFKGKSLGKLITGTRAVMPDGTPVGWGKAFARGFSRAVPFCVFSAFGDPCYPWQDRWTDTLVIDEKKSNIGGRNQDF